MFYKFYILIFICLAGLSVAIHAQSDVNFTSLTTRDGLSSNTVNAIIKDRYGLMWFATEDGLNKFDGTNYKVYRHKPNDSTSLSANEILSLHEDRNENLWIGTGGGSLSLYNRREDAFVNYPTGKGTGKIANNVIRSIASDYQGNVWVAHYNGVDIIEPKTKKVTRFSSQPGIAFSITSTYLFEDSRRNMWIGTMDGLYVVDCRNNTTKHFSHIESNAGSLCDNTVSSITEDGDGNIWIGTLNGLSMLRPGHTEFINYHENDTADNHLSYNAVTALAIGENSTLWIGTGKGLDILDIRTGKITHLQSDPRNLQSLSYNGIMSLYIDKQGIYWVGTFQGGVNKFDKNLTLFHFVQGDPLDETGLHAKIVNAFVEDSKGEIYVGTEDGGLSLFNPVTKAIRHIPLLHGQSDVEKHLSILSLTMTANEQLLIGTYAYGLFVMDLPSGNISQIMQAPRPDALNDSHIFCIMEDRAGNRWVGTNGGGVNVLNRQNSIIFRLTPQPVFPNDIKLPLNGYIRDIVEDKSGLIWIASHGDGMASYDPVSKQFKVYNTRNSQLPSDKVQTILEDSRGIIWAGTLGGGFSMLNKKTGQLQLFSEKEGMRNSNVRKIVEDKNGMIWVSTSQGLSSFDIATKKITNYNNGVQHTNFKHGAGLITTNGNLYFGGTEGFIYFNPKQLKKNTNVPNVLITDLKVSNQSVSPSVEGPIRENISVAKTIHLDYKQNFSLSYVGLNYTAPEQNQYAYKLEGFDKNWNYVGSTTSASYTNIDPGEYTFRVIASNNDGVWNKEGTSITIFVHPPFWRTTYAYVLYLLALVSALFYLHHRNIKRIKQKFIQNQEQKERGRLHELDQLKIKFLTNLSHEFRTPISLILGPADALLAQASNERQMGQLQLIKRNSKRLLNLVNQLLDFRKMEEHELKLQVSKGELVSFVKEVTDSFKDLAERKKIGLEFTCNFEQLHTEFDHDKVERILFNLLSNAFKFTLEGGTVSLTLEKTAATSNDLSTWVTIKINDTGIGIPADQQDKIFERFFQHTTTNAILNQGTGIGLSITREFVEMHGGNINVQSEPGKGTVFIVNMPFVILPAAKNIQPFVQDSNLLVETDVEEQLIEAVETDSTNELKTSSAMSSILLVEDDDDFRYYLKDNLQSKYKVYEAVNGKEGWQKALAQHPQLIVSDVNMPYMDGIELCKKIKSDKRTNHIPIILLTALMGEEALLKGLGTGANDYITKPFNFEVLNAKIRNLLVLNDAFKQTYSRHIKVQAPEVIVELEDEKLMKNIMLYLETNLTNSQLSVEELSRHVGVSRSSLYSKLLELTNQTPVEFIRSVKLDKAAVLLEKSDMTVAQIAYSVGFSTASYFTKSFKTKFNMLPSEYIQKIKSEKQNSDTNE